MAKILAALHAANGDMSGRSLKALTRINSQCWKRSPLLTMTTTKNMTKLPLAVINDVKWIEIFFSIRLLFLQPVTSADLHVHESRFPSLFHFAPLVVARDCVRMNAQAQIKYDNEKRSVSTSGIFFLPPRHHTTKFDKLPWRVHNEISSWWWVD